METVTGNLFGQAQTEIKEPKKTRKEYVELVLSEAVYPSISQTLVGLTQTREEIADMKGAEQAYTEAVKSIAQREFTRLYEEEGINPKTFIMRGEKGGCIMVQPMDKYKTVNQAKVEHLRKVYGTNAITDDIEFIFNAKVLNRPGNMEKISKAIMESDLSDEDKSALITQRVKQTVAKGMIDLFGNYDVEKALQDFEPVFALKNYK